MLENFFPQSADRFVIVRCISRNGKPLVFVPGRDLFTTNLPLRDSKSRDPERAQIWSYVIRNKAEVFADHSRGPSFVQHNAQVFFAFAFVRLGVFGGFVVTWNETWCAAASSFEHLIPIEGKKLLVLPRPPREGIEEIKAKHVIKAKEMKNAPDSPDALAPPLKIPRAHSVPAIEWNAPVLAPFLGESVVLEVRLGRRSAAPIEHEFIRPRENVSAVITDAKWNIAHQGHAAFLSV